MKKAFTLPEAVICVAIVAVIAAIMIPGLIKMRPDEEKLMIKKAYNTVSEIISYLSNDVSVYSRMQADGFADSQVYKDLDDNTYVGNTKFCKVFLSKMTVVSSNVATNGAFQCSATFTSIDGIKWKLQTNPRSTLTADINNRVDQPDYVTIKFIPPKAQNKSFWREINVSRYGRISIEDQNLINIILDSDISKN